MKTKPGVDLTNLDPETLRAMTILDETRQEALATCASIPDAVITAGRDGKHMEGSLHYRGLAVDVRTEDFSWAWANLLKDRLGVGYDIVVEGNHLHVERDPKKLPLTKSATGAVIG